MTKLDLLTPDQAQFIQLLIAGHSQTDAAKILHVNLRTAQRWLTLPHVKSAYDDVKQNIGDYVRGQIEALSDQAIQALKDSLSLDDVPTVKLKAAQLVLDRVAPEIKGDVGQSVQDPLQGKGVSLISPEALQYLTTEDIAAIDAIVQIAEERRLKADNDRETLERKRM